jgi:hypothetical protein
MKEPKMLRVQITNSDQVYEYQIPEMWIIGFTHGGRATIADAIQQWHGQALMAEAFRPASPPETGK